MYLILLFNFLVFMTITIDVYAVGGSTKGKISEEDETSFDLSTGKIEDAMCGEGNVQNTVSRSTRRKEVVKYALSSSYYHSCKGVTVFFGDVINSLTNGANIFTIEKCSTSSLLPMGIEYCKKMQQGLRGEPCFSNKERTALSSKKIFSEHYRNSWMECIALQKMLNSKNENSCSGELPHKYKISFTEKRIIERTCNEVAQLFKSNSDLSARRLELDRSFERVKELKEKIKKFRSNPHLGKASELIAERNTLEKFINKEFQELSDKCSTKLCMGMLVSKLTPGNFTKMKVKYQSMIENRRFEESISKKTTIADRIFRSRAKMVEPDFAFGLSSPSNLGKSRSLNNLCMPSKILQGIIDNEEEFNILAGTIRNVIFHSEEESHSSEDNEK